MKRFFLILCTLCFLCTSALAENSWSQINQEITRPDQWQRYTVPGSFSLGDSVPLEGTDILLQSWGTYPSMDGSTVCVPMAMELARQQLDLPEEDLNGFVNFSTTHYAYLRFVNNEGNPGVSLLSRNAMMDPDHPVDLFLGTAPSEEEKAQLAEAGVELELVPVCYDAFVFLVNAACDVTDLSQEQIRGIYSGALTNWTEVGSKEDVMIRAFQRPANSGSQTAMENMVMRGTPLVAEENYISDGMGDLVAQIGNYNNGKDAIGYSYLYYVDQLYKSGDFRILSVDGVEPVWENMASGAYPYTVCYYAGYRKGNTLAENFVNWMVSDEGQASIAQAGYVPMRDVQ